MTLDAYIVKQGTPESKLLARAGLKRASLPVDTWKGVARSRGGYGKHPVAWRVEGKEQIRQLCETIVSIVGGKAPKKRSSHERTSLLRAKKMLQAFENRGAKKEIVRLFLNRRYPGATVKEMDCVSSGLSQDSHRTIEDLQRRANEKLSGKPLIWQEAQRAFIQVMTSVD